MTRSGRREERGEKWDSRIYRTKTESNGAHELCVFRVVSTHFFANAKASMRLLRPTGSALATPVPFIRAGIIAMCAAALPAMASCAHQKPETAITNVSTGDAVPPPPPPSPPATAPTSSGHWGTVLVAVGSIAPEVRGRADISPATGGQPAAVVILLTGLQPGAAYVWHIRRGSCASTETQGPVSEYAPLTADQQGRGTSTGTFPMTADGLDGYHVDIHAVGGPVVACGDLKGL
jgi:hypothetical protein